MATSRLRLVAVIAVTLAVGFLIGTWRSGTHIETGQAHSTGSGGGSIVTDGWTYGFPADIAWVDTNNSWHDGGLPDCLPPLSIVDGVRFAWVEASIEGSGWRPVVWIDCRGLPLPSAPAFQPPFPPPSPSIQVITGVDANHQIILEPLRQVIPEVLHNSAQLAVFFADYEGVHLGIEGAKLFLLAATATGTVVLDRIVEASGDVQSLPADDYTLVAYYRTCDGNCGFLDPAVEFCSTVQTLEADRQYMLTVRINAKTCAVGSN